MNIDIRKSIINNFKNNSKNDIKEAIISSMNENDEITLPGLGVFFEILWKNSDEEHQDYILNIIESNLKGDWSPFNISILFTIICTLSNLFSTLPNK